jgi:hypothetical protein
MLYESVEALRAGLAAGFTLDAAGRATVADEDWCRREGARLLAENAALNADAAVRDAARYAARRLAAALDVLPASIQDYYAAMGRGETAVRTVPAINLRGLSFDMALALFEAALATDTGAFIFEIARSEVGYTFQEPAEYAAVILAAGVAAGWRGPVFLQGDHVQVKAASYHADADAELGAVKALIRDEIAAGFYNIDVDTSTLVDLSHDDLDAQQRLNYEVGAELTAFIRELEPAGVTISVGGEIGEVGKKNSTVEEFRAYMDGFARSLAARRSGAAGISKISVQTGTSHGGVPRADGSVADVKLDFGVLESIGDAARADYGLSGTVQHGASTLPDDLFDRFPASRASEIHLATGFQNMIFDDDAFPADLRARIHAHLDAEHAGERKEGDSREQFLYKLRKKAWGPFKAELWGLPAATRAHFRARLQGKFVFYMEKLGAAGSRAEVARHVAPVDTPAPPPAGLAG